MIVDIEYLKLFRKLFSEKSTGFHVSWRFIFFPLIIDNGDWSTTMRKLEYLVRVCRKIRNRKPIRKIG